MYTRSGLLAHAAPFGHSAVPFLRIIGKDAAQGVHDDLLLIRRGSGIERRNIVFGLVSLVNQQRGVTAVIHNQLRSFAVGKRHGHRRAPPILGQSLAFPSEHRHTSGSDSRSSMVLRGEDVARTPPHVGPQLDEGFDQHSGLYRHMKRPHDTNAFEGFLRTIFTAHGHQTGHFVLRNLNLLASPLGQRHVGYLIGKRRIQKIHNYPIFQLFSLRYRFRTDAL